MSKRDINALRDLVQIARDGADFYAAAEPEVNDAHLKAVFERMAASKQALIDALAGRLEMIGETPPVSGTQLGALRKAYTDVRASLSSHNEKVYIAQLEQTEDRLLHHFEEALRDSDNDEIRSQLQAHLPRVQACHDEMRRLKAKLSA